MYVIIDGNSCEVLTFCFDVGCVGDGVDIQVGEFLF